MDYTGGGDPPASRKMSQASRRTSNSGSGSGHVPPVPTDVDYQPPPSPLMQGSGQAGGSSPGPPHHHPHPQSLNLPSPSQATGVSSQMKKKSGFQITSVTPAQVNVSTNNSSLADDTESYDDMDESHTEDLLSCSDMIDVSASRATTDAGGAPERSSSDETLNSLHGVETPTGVASPNEPLLHPHALQQPQQQQPPPPGAMVNGAAYHHHQQGHPPPSHGNHHHQHGHQPDNMEVPGGASSVGGSSSTAVGTGLPSQGHMLTQIGSGTVENPAMVPLPSATTTTFTTATHVPLGAVVEQYLLPSNVSTNIIHAVVVGGGGGVVSSYPGPVSYCSQLPGVGGDMMTGGPTTSGGYVLMASAPLVVPVPSTTATIQTQHPGSRFRVVKLDSNTEPFKKGRWTCAEFYEKEVAAAVVTPAVAVAPSDPAPAEMAAPQPYLQSQEYTSPPLQMAPQEPEAHLGGVAHPGPLPTAPQAAVMPQGGGGAMGQVPPAAVPPQQMLYAMDTHPAQPQPGYPPPTLLAPQPPDFIQPTAPFQSQVHQHQPPLVPAGGGVSLPGLPPLPVNQPQGQAPPSQAAPTFAPAQYHYPHQPQPPYATTLRTDLQPFQPLVGNPLHPHGGPLHHGSMASLTTAQLEDASQRLLFQHQSMLGAAMPRQGAGGGGVGGGVGGAGAAGMGMASSTTTGAALVAAAVGLRTHAHTAHTAAHAHKVAVDGDEDSSSGASVVAIDNKIEQAMDLVKSHLMYAVREEVEVLKEQIKDLMERNSQLEQENNLLKTLASPEQMAQFQAQVQTGSPSGSTQPPGLGTAPQQQQQALPSSAQSSETSA